MDFLFILKVCFLSILSKVTTVSYFYLLYNKYRSINKRIDVYTCNFYTVYTHDSAKYVYNILRYRIIAFAIANREMIVKLSRSKSCSLVSISLLKLV